MLRVSWVEYGRWGSIEALGCISAVQLVTMGGLPVSIPQTRSGSGVVND